MLRNGSRLGLTAGFEIMWARAARVGRLPGQTGLVNEEERQPGAVSPMAVPGEEASGGQSLMLTEKQLSELPAWSAYKASLERSGYFEGNIPGSSR